MDKSSSHYTVLARRFRPQRFDDVVGQEHVAQSLCNAIQTGRVAHAYLFTGARGVGKTSMARILAKALNCPQAENAIPCNECEMCRSISAGHDVDVSEIDGASNRGIDDIRSLRANVNVKSMRSKYKIYIIDEVHMLTKEAFNALLKTLEEPPPNVKFVFCTTEPNKVPDTILSRCQRFDFGTIATTKIRTRLADIAAVEGVEVEPAAIELVARRAAGSMRDSQSLFDQLLAFGSDRITAEDVHRLFGTADDERLTEMMEAAIQQRRGDLLSAFSRALDEGVQLSELTDQLTNYLRDLMVSATGADNVELLSVSDSARSTLKQQASRWGLNTIVAALQIMAETKSRMRNAQSSRALAELALIRMSLLEDLERLDELMAAFKNGKRISSKPVTTVSRTILADTSSNVPVSDSPNDETQSAPGAEIPPVTDTNTSPPAGGAAGKVAASIEIQPGCEADLLSQVISLSNDMVKQHLKCASALAISGPNELDFIFSTNYHFQGRYCERPQVRSQLEELVSELTGRPVHIKVTLAEDQNNISADENSANRRVDRGHVDLDAANDSFAQQVLSVFDAKLVRIEGPTSTQFQKD